MKHLTIPISIVLAVGFGLTSVLLWLLTDYSLVTSDTDRPRDATAHVIALAASDAISVYLPMISRNYPAELHVCPNGCPYPSVQAAVDAANDGDVIKVAAGTYTGVNVRPGDNIETTGFVTQVVYLSKTVTIRGGYTTTNWITSYPITQPTTLNAQGHGRVLYITGDDISPTVEGLRLTGGNAAGLGGNYSSDAGGGVYVLYAAAVISNNQVFSNSASYGGGLCVFASPTTLTGNSVFSNVAQYEGGGLDIMYGMAMYGRAATLTGNSVFANTVLWGQAGRGGGLSIGGDATLTGNSIFANTVLLGDGGGLLIGGTVTLTGNSIFANNVLWGNGGGLKIFDGTATLTGNNIFSNTTPFDGGGVHLDSTNSSDATFTNNNVFSNTAQTGGGLLLTSSNITFTHNNVFSNRGGGLALGGWHATLADNRFSSNIGAGLSLASSDAMLINNLVADNVGGGVYIFQSSRCYHTTIARNSGGDGTGVSVNGGRMVDLVNTILVSQTVGITVSDGSAVTLEGTLWGSGAWANKIDWGGAGTITTGTVNIHGDPDFVDPNGGDYHIGAASAAIDAGVASGIATDVDGDPRPAAFGFDIGFDERPGASLQLRHTAQPVLLNPAQRVTYTLAITSAGNIAATNVRLTDTLPTLQQAVSVDTAVGSCMTSGSWGGEATCDLGAMMPGDTIQITLTAQVTTTSPVRLPELMHNTVQVTASETRNTTYADMILQNCHARLNDDPVGYGTVQAAVDASTQPTDVVKAAGYCLGVSPRGGVTQIVYLSKTLTLQGGWDTAFTQRNVISYPTTLDAQGQGRVLYITGDISPTVEGLRLTGGNAAGLGGDPDGNGGDYGGGIFVITANPTITNNQVFSNSATFGGGLTLESSAATLVGNSIFSNTAYAGGGLELTSSAAIIRGNSIFSNSASYGGGLEIGSSAAAVTGNAIFSNRAPSGGGGLLLGSGAATLMDNTVFSNVSSEGGGLYLAYSDGTLIGNIVTANSVDGLYMNFGSPLLVNNVVADNNQGGIDIQASSPNLLHNTIARNGGAGLYVTYYLDCPEFFPCSYDLSYVTITNTILAGNGVGIDVVISNTIKAQGTLWGTGVWANGANWHGEGHIITGTVNVFGDPDFVNPDVGDYHIGANSAARDAGVSAGVMTDIDNQPRPYKAPDLGADEYWPPGTPRYTYLPLVRKTYP